MRRRSARAALPVSLALCASLVSAAAPAAIFEPREFDSPAVEQRYRSLVSELRCLVCQNQNLAESDADLASDLRRQVYEMLHRGASDGDVIDFMVERYGDFVLYRPPLAPRTVLLWLGPFVLAVGGVTWLLVRLRRRAAGAASADLDDEERRRLAALLGKDATGDAGGTR